ncbi:hypothetical protein B0H16DRAFT_340956 [Mycena metata]|uniref:Uncharacterized protein n=1 Tax=Mycena metata TaxID=1033252 RepID=A0AAD7HMN6_9AGAR|nr:hypothetical protein B0H16DRAFT_340956 [Mycena metata]
MQLPTNPLPECYPDQPQSETATDTCSAAGIERDPGLCSVRHNGFDTTADNAIQSFNTTFVVPPLPTSFDSQIMFLSANIRPLDVNGVPFGNLRAALQYGGSGIAGTGPFWTYALQLEVPGEGFFQITIGGANITLDVGQRIDSFIVADPALAVEFPGDNWYIAGFDNIPDSPTIEVGWEVLPQVVALQLEEEGVSGPSDYPAGSFVFEQINLNLTTGPPAALYWNTSGDPATDVQVKVDVEGSRDAQVSIIFPSA